MYTQPLSPNPTRKPSPSTVAFGRGAAGPNPMVLYDQVMKSAGMPQRILGELLKRKEGVGGNSHAKFLQDTSILWLPKSLISRSGVEFFETTFLEFVESAFFYYVAPLALAPLASKAFTRLAPKALRPDARWVTSELKNVPKAELAKVLPVKAATILTGILVTAISGEYALNFVKNLITDKAFKLHQFSDIIRLTQKDHKAVSQENDTPVAKKAKHRIAACLAVGAGILLASAGLARWGHRMPMLQKPVQKLVEIFDFRYAAKAGGKMGFDLTQPHLKVMMPIAVLGYIDSARDHLERVEVGCRASITGWYIGYGSEILENLFYGKFRQKPGYKDVFKKDGGLRSWLQIQTDVLQEMGNKSWQAMSSAEQGEAVKRMAPRFGNKAKMVMAPYLFGILVVGLFTAAMNQYWTHVRFSREQSQKRLLAERFLNMPVGYPAGARPSVNHRA